MPRDVLTSVARRIWLVDAVIAVSTGMVVCTLIAVSLFLAGIPSWTTKSGLAVLSGVLAAAFVWRRGAPQRGPAAAAAAIERTSPAGNVIVTAEELQRHPARAPEWIHGRVMAQAAAHLASVEVGTIVPVRPAALAAAAAALALAALALVILKPRSILQPITRVQQAAVQLVSDRAAPSIRVTIEPPAYTGRPSVTLQDPVRIEAFEGSVIRFQTREGTVLRFGEKAFTGAFVAREDGYFALEHPPGSDRSLVPLVITRDSAPTVRVEDPGKDLLLPAGPRKIPLTFDAVDDLGLGTLELRYTKVSGTGEQFEFQEGRLPIELERVSPREWRGRGQLSLSDLRLESGDSIVYRVVARDQRPGDAGIGSSDTYFIEIVGPGQVALDGVEMPADMERYALSQQMIVLKLERLRARERTIAREAVVEETQAIAAEQRAVRANFIFLMGGHVEDEEVEAEQSHEIQEGRLENTARRDIDTAIRHMTGVEQGLAAVSTAAALPPARLAVEALQRAFGRSRYLLRSLAVRSRLDMSRRLTGDTKAAQSWRRDPADPEKNDAGSRVVFDRLVQTGRRLRNQESVSVGEWQALAESALRVDPSSAFWQEASRSLADIAGTDSATALGRLEQVLREVAAAAAKESLPSLPAGTSTSPLSRAWQLEGRR